MLKHFAGNRKRRLSALPNVGIYTTLKFLALQGAPYMYDISRRRVKLGKSGNEIIDMLVQVYGNNAMKKMTV
jgi:hypothetical protein